MTPRSGSGFHVAVVRNGCVIHAKITHYDN